MTTTKPMTLQPPRGKKLRPLTPSKQASTQCPPASSTMPSSSAPDMPRLTPLKADLASIAEDYRHGQTGRHYGLDTGFSGLNDALNGLGPGLLALGGVPDTGKTALALQLADQLIRHNDETLVLFYTYEQSVHDLAPFILARRSGVEMDEVTRPATTATRSTRADAWDKIHSSIMKSSVSLDTNLYIVEADGRHTLDHIQSEIAQMKSNFPSHSVVLIIDYLQLMPLPASVRVFSDVERLDKLCYQLTTLARNQAMPVIALSSITRKHYGKTQADTFKGSGTIEYASSVAAILDDTQVLKENNRELRLVISKNRHGKRFVEIGFSFDPSRATFREIPTGA